MFVVVVRYQACPRVPACQSTQPAPGPTIRPIRQKPAVPHLLPADFHPSKGGERVGEREGSAVSRRVRSAGVLQHAERWPRLARRRRSTWSSSRRRRRSTSCMARAAGPRRCCRRRRRRRWRASTNSTGSCTRCGRPPAARRILRLPLPCGGYQRGLTSPPSCARGCPVLTQTEDGVAGLPPHIKKLYTEAAEGGIGGRHPRAMDSASACRSLGTSWQPPAPSLPP